MIANKLITPSSIKPFATQRIKSIKKSDLLEGGIKFAEEYFKLKNSTGNEYIRICLAIKDGNTPNIDANNLKLIIGAVSIKCDSLKDLADLKTIILKHKDNIHELSKNESRFFVKNFTRGFTKLLALGKRSGATEVKSIQEYIYTVVKGYVNDAYRVKKLENAYVNGSHKSRALKEELTSSLAVYKKELLSSNYLDDMVFNFDSVNKNISAIQFGKRSYKITHTYSFAAAIKSIKTYVQDAFEAIAKPQPTANDKLRAIFSSKDFTPHSVILYVIKELKGKGFIKNAAGVYALDIKRAKDLVNGLDNLPRLLHFRIKEVNNLLDNIDSSSINLFLDDNGKKLINFGSGITWDVSEYNGLHSQQFLFDSLPHLTQCYVNDYFKNKYYDQQQCHRMDEVEASMGTAYDNLKINNQKYPDYLAELSSSKILTPENIIDPDVQLRLFLSCTDSIIGGVYSSVNDALSSCYSLPPLYTFKPEFHYSILPETNNKYEVLLNIKGESSRLNIETVLIIDKQRLVNFWDKNNQSGLNPIVKTMVIKVDLNVMDAYKDKDNKINNEAFSSQIYSSKQLSHSFNLAIKNMPDNLEDKKSDLERVKNIVDFPVYNPAALVLTAIEVFGEKVFDKNNNNGEYLLNTKNILQWVTTQINGINAGLQSEKNVGRLEHFKQMINSENFPQIKLTFNSNGLPVITFGSDIDWDLSANKNFILNALRAIMQNASSLKLSKINTLGADYLDRMKDIEHDITRADPRSSLLYIDAASTDKDKSFKEGRYESLKDHIPVETDLVKIEGNTLDNKLKQFLIKQLIGSLTVSLLGELITQMGNTLIVQKFDPIDKFTIRKGSDDSTEILVDLEVEGEWKDAAINMTCTLVIDKELLNNFFSPKDLLGLNPITKIKYHDVNAKLGSMPTIQKMSTAEGMNFYL